jgi:CubicO group peptidase (beta-lactamase class C family)
MKPSNAESPIPEVIYPGKTWETATPKEAGFDPDEWCQWLAQQNPEGAAIAGESHPGDEWGAAIVRRGYLIHTWGDPTYRYNSASVGKCFTRLCLQLAVDRGLIADADDPIREYWTGEGQLNHPDKYLVNGHHRSLTFKHTLTMDGGFPVSNGFTWRQGERPNWADPHGNDPDRANYAQRPPGSGYHYSSGGFWRCTQALTAIFDRELKDVLDQVLFRKIGIPADRWEWFTGRHLRETKDFYPGWPGYGDFADPPYEIGGHRVQGGGGWVAMSPLDMARIGLLLATGGIWNGEHLIESGEFVIRGQSNDTRGWNGGNSSTLSAWSDPPLVVTAVTTSGLDWGNVPRPVDHPR